MEQFRRDLYLLMCTCAHIYNVFFPSCSSHLTLMHNLLPSVNNVCAKGTG